MPKVATSSSNKVSKLVRQYPQEFSATPSNALFCKLCEQIVKHERTFFVESHRASQKHKNKLKPTTASTSQLYIEATSSSFAEQVTKCFVAANIPLHKLRHPAIDELFKSMGRAVPSETSCRRIVPDLVTREKEKVKEYVSEKEIFLIVDESDVEGRKIMNILVGTLDTPSKTFMIGCLALEGNINSQVVGCAIDDVIRFLAVNRQDFVLLLSDAARYMVLAGTYLKNMYPKLFHVTCIAHLLHNCAMLVKAKFPHVNTLISTVKAATVKNGERRQLFSAIGNPPQPVLTRWGTWLDAAFWYGENLPQVLEIVSQFEGDLLVTRCKEAVAAESLQQDLMVIQQYRPLRALINKCESTDYTMVEAMNDCQALHFDSDPCDILNYMKQRLDKNDLRSIMAMSRDGVSPATYARLQHCQPTSCAVERSFSIIRHILRKERNFSACNIEQYAILNFNYR